MIPIERMPSRKREVSAADCLIIGLSCILLVLGEAVGWWL